MDLYNEKRPISFEELKGRFNLPQIAFFQIFTIEKLYSFQSKTISPTTSFDH
jgi:hypothetical protein